MRHAVYPCPKCTMPHSGPWTRCYLCQYDKLKEPVPEHKDEDYPNGDHHDRPTQPN